MKPTHLSTLRPETELLRLSEEFLRFTLLNAQSITGLAKPILQAALQRLQKCELLYEEQLPSGEKVYEWNGEKLEA